ncbi:hypothetical protein PR001_g32914 [Phytophthora rubi]|uniref:Regulator of chromosome condensation 1/beta-lactamase-inhibitor protein II n=1 Tax=Phytophthora rubi TaxID=129364 RepID=A0A6A3G4M5_9STRA|nr:hypothetical protein PR001_g32914 [Phytophthora rubi]KAE8953395.1 hypothetical protein PR002_g32398 [Phytophthora rubi]
MIPAVRHIRFRSISCGFGHSLALSTDGTVYAWGSASHGKLGIGPVRAKESFTLAPVVLSSLIRSGVRTEDDLDLETDEMSVKIECLATVVNFE